MIENLPIRIRLTVWYAAVLSLGLALFSLTVWLGLRHILYADLAATLANQARGFEEYLHIEDRDQTVDMAREMDEYSRSLPQDHVLAVYDRAGNLIYSNQPDAARKFAGGQHLARSAQPQKFPWKHQHYLGVSRPFSMSQGPFRMFLALPSDSTERAISLLGVVLIFAVPVFIVCAAGGGYWLSRRALLPVDRITERARTIGVGTLGERLAVPATHDELQRLTETWNGMLGRLETAVSRISRFTADASHELRTPLAIIRLAAENALRKTRSESEYRAALEHIQRESENMTRLIEDLLFLARADVDDSAAVPELIDLGEVVRAVCSDLTPFVLAKSLTFTQDLPSQPLQISGNFSDIRRMLVILLDNAIKYTPAGGFIAIHLEQGPLEQGREQAILRVEDSGIGIPEADRIRVFQRFFRVDPSRSKASGGYGLGLAIAQTIVERHNASIDLQTRSGGGCVFCVSLPIAA